MIPRYQRVLFWLLLLASVVMAAVLFRLRERAADRVSSQAVDTTSPGEPAAVEESMTLYEADDLSGTLFPVTRRLALPQETGARARVLLRQLLADYSDSASKHPLAPGTAIDGVFFMTIERSPDAEKSINSGSSPQTAIVNLSGTFAENHPSGIEVETLTLLSIIATLQESFPQVRQVRFLVNGEPRATLAGHADLDRAYLTGSHP